MPCYQWFHEQFSQKSTASKYFQAFVKSPTELIKYSWNTARNSFRSKPHISKITINVKRISKILQLMRLELTRNSFKKHAQSALSWRRKDNGFGGIEIPQKTPGRPRSCSHICGKLRRLSRSRPNKRVDMHRKSHNQESWTRTGEGLEYPRSAAAVNKD